MESDSKLSSEPVTDRKLVTTRAGDQGRTSLGMHGFVGKDDPRIELMGGLDLLRTLSHSLPTQPPWLASMLTDMMVALVRAHDLQHDERLRVLDESVSILRDGVTFSSTGWFTPTHEHSCKWDVFRVHVRKVERDAWRAYGENEKERFKEMAQQLNRLSDYAFLCAMWHEQR